MRQRDEGRDVGRDHRAPVVELRLLRGLGAERQAGVVDEEVDVAPVGGQAVERGGGGGVVGDVEGERVDRIAQFGLQRVEPVGAAAGGDDAPAGADEFLGGGGTDAGGGAGDEGGLGHGVSHEREECLQV